MAGEMIVAVDLKKQCEECRQSCEEYDGFYADCDQCPFAEKAIKRTEAIERMAKALYDKYEVRCNSDDCPNEGPICEGCPVWEKYEKMAEAALDALLEVSRNE